MLFRNKQYGSVVVRFRRALALAMPKVSEDDLVWRMHFMFGTMAYTNAGMDAIQLIASCATAHSEDQAAVLKRLVKFLVAGLKSE